MKRERLVDLLDEFALEAYAEGQISLARFIAHVSNAVHELED